MPVDNKRTFQRLHRRLAVRFSLGGRDQVGFTANISPSGLLLLTQGPLAIEGKDFVFTLDLPTGRSQPMTGKIVREHWLLPRDGIKKVMATGIQITGFDERYLAFLQEIFTA